jgi:hypothetical protein
MLMNHPTNFSIALNQPKYVLPKGKGHDLMTVFSVCFEFPNDNFEMHWNGIVIPCSYDHMVAHIIFPVLDMLNAISSKKKGEHALIFGMNGLQCNWQLSWNKNDLQIESEWREAPLDSFDALKEHPRLETCTHSFLLEWQKLIQFLIDIIDRSGVKIECRWYTHKYLLRVDRKVAKRIAELGDKLNLT